MVNFFTYIELFLNDLNKQINLNEFENYYKKPHQTIKRHLSVLMKKNILIAEKKGRFLFYKLNLENPLLFEYLSICEKQRMFDFLEKLLFKRLYDFVYKNFKDSNVIIFGSAINKKEFSDIDILIFPENKDLEKKLKEFSDTYSVKLHLVMANEKNITETLKKEIIKNHIILNNHDNILRFFYEN